MVRKIIIVALTFGTVGTLILGVATLVLPRPIIWGRMWQDEEFFGNRQWAITVHRGILWTVHQSGLDKKLRSFRLGTNRSFVERHVHSTVGSQFTTMLKLPLWIPFLAFTAFPTIAFLRGPVRRNRRRKRGLCVGCGYNLTGLTVPRCPECGAAATIPDGRHAG